MVKRIPLAMGAWLLLQSPSWAVNLRGTISNQAGKAISKAMATLIPLGLSDTTGADGLYSIVTSGTFEHPDLADRTIAFREGILEIRLAESAPVRVDLFDTRGSLLRTEGLGRAEPGVYRWDIGSFARGGGVLVVRVVVADHSTTFRHALVPGSADASATGIRSVGGSLARTSAIGDSLRVSAAGYKSRTVAVPTLEGTLDVKLDTLEGGNSLKNPPVASSGCGKSPTLASGSRTISVAGQNRSYMLRIPPDYDRNHPYPLVFAFHWNGGSMGDVDGGGTSGYTWSYYGLREKADKSTDQRMIFVTPQGLNAGWANSNGQDLALVDNLLKVAKEDLCVDTTRVFSMGFSYGGGMTYAIACARAGTFRAAAVYAGAQLSGCSDGSKPIAYIGVHGLRDPTCSIAGGRTLRDRFVKNNGCTAQNPPEPAANSLKHTCTTYSGCKSGYPVRWCAFDGAGHSPAPVDGTTSDYGGGDKTWTKDEVWNFFTQF